jgi:hypothetical protein
MTQLLHCPRFSEPIGFALEALPEGVCVWSHA